MLVYNGIDLIKRHVSSHFFIFESSQSDKYDRKCQSEVRISIVPVCFCKWLIIRLLIVYY